MLIHWLHYFSSHVAIILLVKLVAVFWLNNSIAINLGTGSTIHIQIIPIRLHQVWHDSIWLPFTMVARVMNLSPSIRTINLNPEVDQFVALSLTVGQIDIFIHVSVRIRTKMRLFFQSNWVRLRKWQWPGWFACQEFSLKFRNTLFLQFVMTIQWNAAANWANSISNFSKTANKEHPVHQMEMLALAKTKVVIAHQEVVNVNQEIANANKNMASANINRCWILILIPC